MCSPRNIIGVVMEVDEEKSLYKMGTIEGVLQTLFTRGQFDVRPESFLNPGDLPERSSTFVREAHGKTEVPGAQGFTRCNCKTGCSSNRSKCFKDKVQCNSKCHSSLTYNNKHASEKVAKNKTNKMAEITR